MKTKDENFTIKQRLIGKNKKILEKNVEQTWIKGTNLLKKNSLFLLVFGEGKEEKGLSKGMRLDLRKLRGAFGTNSEGGAGGEDNKRARGNRLTKGIAFSKRERQIETPLNLNSRVGFN